MIEADGGGSNGSTSRRFKFRLQEFADETGLAVTVCHYPPGASKWNPIEHKLFSQYSRPRGPGSSWPTVAVLVGLIRPDDDPQPGCGWTARVMTKKYPTGVKIDGGDSMRINLDQAKTCPQWNCTIRPRTRGRTRSSRSDGS